MMIHGHRSKWWCYPNCTKLQRLLLLRVCTLHSPARKSHLARLRCLCIFWNRWNDHELPGSRKNQTKSKGKHNQQRKDKESFQPLFQSYPVWMGTEHAWLIPPWLLWRHESVLEAIKLSHVIKTKTNKRKNVHKKMNGLIYIKKVTWNNYWRLTSKNHGNTVLPAASSLPHGQLLPIWQVVKANNTHAIQTHVSMESMCSIHSILANIVNHVTNHHRHPSCDPCGRPSTPKNAADLNKEPKFMWSVIPWRHCCCEGVVRLWRSASSFVICLEKKQRHLRSKG